MKQQSSERGFVLLFLLFFLTALAFILVTLVPSYMMQSHRDMEDELIFRGAEYARAIQKYQNKCGLLPLTTDELIQGCGDGIPTLRKRYLDPTNGKEFRMIYANTGGTVTQQTGLVGVASQNDRIAVKRYINQDRYVNWEFIANVNNPAGLNNRGTSLTNTGGGRGGN